MQRPSKGGFGLWQEDPEGYVSKCGQATFGQVLVYFIFDLCSIPEKAIGINVIVSWRRDQ